MKVSESSVAFRFDHLHLYAESVEHTAAWYERMLGATILRMRQSDGRPRVELVLGGVSFYLSDAASLARNLGQELAPSAPSPHRGLDHFGLEVDDVQAAARQLVERGAPVRIGPKRLRPGVDVLFVEAPDGVVIEVVSRDRTIDAMPDAGAS